MNRLFFEYLLQAKPYSWLPGNGMSLELHTKSHKYVFGALYNRDECLDILISVGAKAELFWATAYMDKRIQQSSVDDSEA